MSEPITRPAAPCETQYRNSSEWQLVKVDYIKKLEAYADSIEVERDDYKADKERLEEEVASLREENRRCYVIIKGLEQAAHKRSSKLHALRNLVEKHTKLFNEISDNLGVCE